MLLNMDIKWNDKRNARVTKYINSPPNPKVKENYLSK